MGEARKRNERHTARQVAETRERGGSKGLWLGALFWWLSVFNILFLTTPIAVMNQPRQQGWRTLYVFGFRIAQWNVAS